MQQDSRLDSLLNTIVDEMNPYYQRKYEQNNYASIMWVKSNKASHHVSCVWLLCNVSLIAKHNACICNSPCNVTEFFRAFGMHIDLSTTKKTNLWKRPNSPKTLLLWDRSCLSKWGGEYFQLEGFQIIRVQNLCINPCSDPLGKWQKKSMVCMSFGASTHVTMTQHKCGIHCAFHLSRICPDFVCAESL